MSKNYLGKKIQSFERLIVFIVAVLITISYLCGRYIKINNWLNIFLGMGLGVAGGITIAFLEKFIGKRQNFAKGKKLEDAVEKKLQSFDYERNIETGYGDLDFLIKTRFGNYGLEIKSYDGRVEFKNGILYVNNFDCTWMISSLLQNCKIVRNNKFGSSSGEYVKPILVFGYKTSVNILNNIITFNGVEIIITDVQRFTTYIK